MPRSSLIPAILALALSVPSALNAQKAEPKRIQFAKGASAVLLSEKLTGSQQMEYALSARAGQKVTLRLTAQPAGSLSLRMRDPNQKDVPLTGAKPTAQTQFVVLPENGDYDLWVVRKPGPGSSTFRLKLSIR